MEQNQHEIKLMLDDDRYNNLLDLCKKYRTQHSTNLTPTEYILILIDSAIDSVDGTKSRVRDQRRSNSTEMLVCNCCRFT